MAGLRALNKADRSRRILDSASRLFRAAGYDAVRIEDIAQDARMSPGTVYNHFETKGDVLLAIVAMEVEEVLAEGEALLADPPDDIEAALNALVGAYYAHSLHYLSKAMWRTAMAQSIAAPGARFSATYTALDRSLTDQICRLVAALQARGRVRQGVDPRTLGEIVFNDINMMFIEFVKDDGQVIETLMESLRRHMALVAAAAAG
ncbi:MAG: TetR/AcrR family transcriptional regulator [Rhodobacteraceae bacterium]|nr:TetR/AcrR family transcriptional regulator [Paracoccaceae bacterium]